MQQVNFTRYFCAQKVSEIFQGFSHQILAGSGNTGGKGKFI
jgi:hypothetical protein